MAMDIDKICRTCLALSGTLLSIYQNSDSGCLADMLGNFTKNRPRRADNLPEKVCLSCISEINRCYSFKLKCENSNRTLQQLLPDAAVLEESAAENAPKPEQVHRSSQTGATQTANVEVQTTTAKQEKQTTDMATSPLAPPKRLPREMSKAHLTKKAKLEQDFPIVVEEQQPLATVDELEEVVSDDGDGDEVEEFMVDKVEETTFKRKRNVRFKTSAELILEVSSMLETDANDAMEELHEADEEEEEEVQENAPASSATNEEDEQTYYEEHFEYDEEGDGEAPKNETQTYYVEEHSEHQELDGETEEGGAAVELEEHEEYEQLIENLTEEEDASAATAGTAEPTVAAKTLTPKDADYNFTIYKNIYGEAEVRPKRPRVKRQNTVAVTSTGERVSNKCPQCPMTFISKKTLARHMLKRHDWPIERVESMKNEWEQEATKKLAVNSTTLASNVLVLDGVTVQQDEEEEEENGEEALLTLPHEMRATLLQQLKKEIELDKKDPATIPVRGSTASKDIVDSSQPLVDFPYSCGHCKAGFAARKTLNYHRKLNICGTRSYECSECNRVFVSQQNLDEHKAQHVLSDICNECNSVFETAEALSVHMVQEHNRKRRHQCNICMKVFTMLSALKDHERTHSGEKPYHCTICDKSFSQNANLKQHVMRHSNEKKFKCEHCTSAYVTKAELYSHTRKHTGEHPYRCEYCETTFTSSSSLSKHKRKHTGERPYACDICPMRFTALNVLKNHRRTHTGEKPFKCPYCNKAFTQKGDCAIHQRTHTGTKRVRNRKTAASSAKQPDDQMHITIVNVDDDSVMLEASQNTAATGDEELIQIAIEDMGC